ncbi:MMPL family transporter [Mycolicibacterium fortuitum]|uniref:MMPL family transporter n=1 Tax=Mycolicibacterium fortuitum TaxID=1766 RepID=UPI002E26D866|nr:MMPL family transporter [Mycolicibacterium fortuitum]
MTAMVLGAGTDYGIFLLANYHEGRRRGMPVDDAVARSGAHTAGIVIASALTIAVTSAMVKFETVRRSLPPSHEITGRATANEMPTVRSGIIDVISDR